MKTLFSYFLLIFLVATGTYTYADTGRESIVCSYNPVHTPKNLNIRLKAVELAEEDDDESPTFKKKYAEQSNLTSFTTHALSNDYRFSILERRQVSRKKMLPVARDKYLLFSVLRI